MAVGLSDMQLIIWTVCGKVNKNHYTFTIYPFIEILALREGYFDQCIAGSMLY